MSKNKATTIHGEIPYETVDCCSCDEEIAKENAKRVVVGDIYDKNGLYGISTRTRYVEYHFRKSLSDGWVCPYCREDPAKFPSEGYSLNPQKAFIAGGLIMFFLTNLVWVVSL